MLLPVIFGAIGAIAVAHRLDPDTQIEENFKKVMDPTLPPGERQEAYQRATRIDSSRYDGESFADLDREEIFHASRQKEQYQSVLAKVDKALESGAISQDQHQALSNQYNGAIKSIDSWLNK